jgi:hypothetical protein
MKGQVNAAIFGIGLIIFAAGTVALAPMVDRPDDVMERNDTNNTAGGERTGGDAVESTQVEAVNNPFQLSNSQSRQDVNTALEVTGGSFCTFETDEMVSPYEPTDVYKAPNGCIIGFLSERGWTRR